jgi:hypothetical protein
MSVTVAPAQGFNPNTILFHSTSDFHATYTDIIFMIFPRKFDSLFAILLGNIGKEYFTEPLSIPSHSLTAIYPVLLHIGNKGKCHPHLTVLFLLPPSFLMHVYNSEEDDDTFQEESICCHIQIQ